MVYHKSVFFNAGDNATTILFANHYYDCLVLKRLLDLPSLALICRISFTIKHDINLLHPVKFSFPSQPQVQWLYVIVWLMSIDEFVVKIQAVHASLT